MKATGGSQINNQSQNVSIQPIIGRKSSADIQTKQQDTKSVFVQNVDYGTTSQQLQVIFEDCGTIVRVTILKQKATNKSKGLAYIQFSDVQSVFHAMMLSGTTLRNRIIKVTQKRTNVRGVTNKSQVGKQLFFKKFINDLTRNRKE